MAADLSFPGIPTIASSARRLRNLWGFGGTILVPAPRQITGIRLERATTGDELLSVIIGLVVGIGSMLGGYMAMGGKGGTPQHVAQRGGARGRGSLLGSLMRKR